MKFGFITLTLTCLVTPASPLVKTGFGNKLDNFTNVIITSDILSEVSSIRSTVKCMSLCLLTEACVSVFYRQQHRRCQLHDVLFISPLEGQEEAGTVYYSLTTGTCPPGYIHNRFLNFCYQFHLDRIAYPKGLADCSSRGEHLVTIDSPDKQSHFVKQVTASTDSKTYSYYIDGSDVATEGQWVYHDSRTVTYLAWAPGYPDNSTVTRDYLAASRAYAFRWQTGLRMKQNTMLANNIDGVSSMTCCYVSPEWKRKDRDSVLQSWYRCLSNGYTHNRLLNFCCQLHLDKILYIEGLADCRSRGEQFIVIDSPEK